MGYEFIHKVQCETLLSSFLVVAAYFVYATRPEKGHCEEIRKTVEDNGQGKDVDTDLSSMAIHVYPTTINTVQDTVLSF